MQKKEKNEKLNPLDSHILWYISIPAKEMTWKFYKTGKEVVKRKAQDGKATYEEIEDFLKNCLKVTVPVSRATIHRRLKKLEKKGKIENISIKGKEVDPKHQGKRAVYQVTALGDTDLLRHFYDVKILLGESSGVLGHEKNVNGQLYFLPMVRIDDKEDVKLMLEGMRVSSNRKEAEVFLKDVFEIQKLSIMLYCLNLVNSSVKMVIEDAFTPEELNNVPRRLAQLFKIYLK